MIIIEEIPEVPQCEILNERMTREEMESRFPDEWVFVVDPETSENLRVIRGTVKCHSKDPTRVEQVAVQLKPRNSALFLLAVTPDKEMYGL